MSFVEDPQACAILYTEHLPPSAEPFRRSKHSIQMLIIMLCYRVQSRLIWRWGGLYDLLGRAADLGGGISCVRIDMICYRR